jgi:hypothetical protein
MTMVKQMLRMRGRPPTEFANQSEVNEADQAALASPGGREEGQAEDEELSDFEAEVIDHQAGGQPRSEITGGPQGGTPDEDKDGLDEVARALRDAAEAPVNTKREVGR